MLPALKEVRGRETVKKGLDKMIHSKEFNALITFVAAIAGILAFRKSDPEVLHNIQWLLGFGSLLLGAGIMMLISLASWNFSTKFDKLIGQITGFWIAAAVLFFAIAYLDQSSKQNSNRAIVRIVNGIGSPKPNGVSKVLPSKKLFGWSAKANAKPAKSANTGGAKDVRSRGQLEAGSNLWAPNADRASPPNANSTVEPASGAGDCCVDQDGGAVTGDGQYGDDGDFGDFGASES